jgi:nicotinic acid mononucleotide adenylyltransferase
VEGSGKNCVSSRFPCPYTAKKLIYHIYSNLLINSVDESEKDSISVGTAALLDYLASVYNDYEFYFCLGADSFLDLINNKWQHTDRILNELLFSRTDDQVYRRIVVLFRSDPKITCDTNDLRNSNVNLQQQSSYDREQHYKAVQQFVQEYGAQLIHMERSEENISSTFVRNCSDVSKLQNNAAVILPDVLQYIVQHNLYQFCN